MNSDSNSDVLTPRQRFIAALERKPPTGRVPHFELVFFLTMEAFGKLHPCQRNYAQWDQMEEKERHLRLAPGRTTLDVSETARSRRVGDRLTDK